MDVQLERRREPHRAVRQQGDAQGAQGGQQAARIDEQELGAVQQQEAQVTPAVAPSLQVRPPRAAIRLQRGGRLADDEAAQGRLDHHLAGELHPGALQPQRQDRLAGKSAQTAVEVADGDLEEQPAQE